MFKNFKIRTKILIGYVIAIMMVSVLGVFSLKQMKTINEKTQDIASNWMPTIYYVSDMNTIHVQLRAETYKHVLITTSNGKAEVVNEIKNILKFTMTMLLFMKSR